jgi:hypothetical protein
MTDSIRRRQLEWAKSRSLPTDAKGYLLQPAHNLPWLTPRTKADFDAADGAEFGRGTGRVKICALHSSSALAVNFFDYWTTRDRESLAAALGLTRGIENIRFEQRFPTGVGSRAPNVDVVIHGPDQRMLAIESKFCEPFSSRSKLIQDKYFPNGTELWTRAGLKGGQHAAFSLRAANAFRFVDAPQLLKHMLGLAQTGSNWHLLLLWYVPAELRQAMSEEANRFRTLLGADAARFSTMSYQDVWSRLYPTLSVAHREYAEYIHERYFLARVV